MRGTKRALCHDSACRVAHNRGLREANSWHSFTMVPTWVVLQVFGYCVTLPCCTQCRAAKPTNASQAAGVQPTHSKLHKLLCGLQSLPMQAKYTDSCNLHKGSSTQCTAEVQNQQLQAKQQGCNLHTASCTICSVNWKACRCKLSILYTATMC